MASQPIKLEGADTFARTLRQAGHDLADLKTEHASSGRLILGTARSLAPRRTGRLSASGVVTATPTAGEVTFTATYARPIHAGVPSRGITATPFLTDAARQTQGRWTAVYTAAVTNALRKVRGL